MYNIVVDAVVAQTVEHFLGKEEVGSSSLLNSSKKITTIFNGRYFFVFVSIIYFTVKHNTNN